MGALDSLLVAVAALIAGLFLGYWWNRGRPLLVHQGFSGIYKRAQKLRIPEAVNKIAGKCWHSELNGAEGTLGDMKDAVDYAKLYKKHFQSALDDIPRWIEELEQSKDEETTRSVLKSFMTDIGTETGIFMSLMRNELRLEEPDRSGFQSPPQLIEESPDDRGCYRLVWKTTISRFGKGLDSLKFARVRLSPFVNAMRFLHNRSLIETLQQVVPRLAEQVRVSETLIENLEEPVNSQSRFCAKLLVGNYGAMPLMLWPQAVLEVRHKSIGVKIKVPCYVAIEDEEGQVYDLKGIHSVAPGERVLAWVISSSVQSKIEEGSVLRTCLDGGIAQARAQLRFSYAAAFGRNRLWSDWSVFSDEDSEKTL